MRSGGQPIRSLSPIFRSAAHMALSMNNSDSATVFSEAVQSWLLYPEQMRYSPANHRITQSDSYHSNQALCILWRNSGETSTPEAWKYTQESFTAHSKRLPIRYLNAIYLYIPTSSIRTARQRQAVNNFNIVTTDRKHMLCYWYPYFRFVVRFVVISYICFRNYS